MGIVADMRWYLRSRVSRGVSIDGMRGADSLGRPCEVVSPRWWDLRRWWAWLKADGYSEHVLYGPDDVARFYRFRTRTVPRLAPPALVVAGRRIAPRPVTEEEIERYVQRRRE